MDNLTPDQRKKTMARIKSKDTKPEIAVRRLIHRMGYRFRLHRRDLPGNPDLVFPKFRKVIFIHGCFWHGHHCRSGKNRPLSNRDYWDAKLDKNKARDKKNRRMLKKLGWETLVIWECQIADSSTLRKRIVEFLEKSEHAQ